MSPKSELGGRGALAQHDAHVWPDRAERATTLVCGSDSSAVRLHAHECIVLTHPSLQSAPGTSLALSAAIFGSASGSTIMSDCEWDDLALPVQRPASAVVVAMGSAGGDGGVLALPARGRCGWQVKLPPPERRAREQHLLAAACMREAKSQRHRVLERRAGVESVNRVFDHLRAAGLLLDKGVRAAISSQGLVVQGLVSNRKIRIALALTIAYCDVMRRNDVARPYRVSARTVGRLRAAVAHCVLKHDGAVLSAVAEAFRRRPPSVFARAACCDATKERFKFAVHPGLLPETTRSAWNVLMSSQRFSCPRAHSRVGTKRLRKSLGTPMTLCARRS